MSRENVVDVFRYVQQNIASVCDQSLSEIIRENNLPKAYIDP